MSAPFDVEREWFGGKVAIVTGGRTGIGLGIARMLVAAGTSVAITGRAAASVEHAARDLQPHGGKARGIGMDVTSSEDARRMVQRTLERFGRLDFLVSSAGARAFGKVQDMALVEWNEVMDVQLTGTFLCCQAAIDPLMETGGRIVNMGSIY